VGPKESEDNQDSSCESDEDSQSSESASVIFEDQDI